LVVVPLTPEQRCGHSVRLSAFAANHDGPRIAA
jgi:hypothetical protein